MEKFTKGMNSDDRSIPQGDYRPAGEIELGTCDVCHKKEVAVSRKYYKYPIPCNCCNKLGTPPHFEIVRYCKNCIPHSPLRVSALVMPLPGDAEVINHALVTIRRNIETAADYNLYPDSNKNTLMDYLREQLEHRRKVAIRLLFATKEPQADDVIKELHNLFEFDQDQLRHLLGLTED